MDVGEAKLCPEVQGCSVPVCGSHRFGLESRGRWGSKLPPGACGLPLDFSSFLFAMTAGGGWHRTRLFLLSDQVCADPGLKVIRDLCAPGYEMHTHTFTHTGVGSLSSPEVF